MGRLVVLTEFDEHQSAEAVRSQVILRGERQCQSVLAEAGGKCRNLLKSITNGRPISVQAPSPPAPCDAVRRFSGCSH